MKLSARELIIRSVRRAAPPMKKKKTTMGDDTGPTGSRCGGTTAVVFAWDRS